MANKTMAQLLEEMGNKKAFKSDDTVSEIEQVGLDSSAPDDDLPELEDGGKSKAGKSAEEKTNAQSTKSGQDKMEKIKKIAEDKKENPFAKKDDEDMEDEDDEDLKEALRLYGAISEAEFDDEMDDEDEDDEDEDEDDLKEGRVAHPLTPQELALRKAITAKSSLLHYYAKGKKAGTKYSKNARNNPETVKKELDVLKQQFKALRAKSHPKNKSMLNNSVEVDVRKVTTEDFDATADLNAIFGSDNSLSESFKGKVQTIYEASVIAQANEVVQNVYKELKEAFVTEQELLVSELTEAYTAKVDELTESIDRYLDKTVTDWKRENAVAIESKAKAEIAESFMSKLKTLFEDHYIDLPEDKISIVESQKNEIASLEEKLQEEIDRNIALTEEIAQAERTKIIEGLSEGLSDAQKEKFALLAESFESTDKEEFITKLNEVKVAYFSKTSKKVIKEELEAETKIDLKEEASKGTDPVMNMFVKYLGAKK